MTESAERARSNVGARGWYSTVGVIRRRWWLILSCGLIGAVVGVSLSLATSPVYESSASLYVTSGQDPDSQSAYQGLLASQQRVASYARLASSDAVVSRALSSSGMSGSVEDAQAKISASPSLNTVMLTVSARGSTADQAALLANSVSDSLVNYVKELEVPAGGGSPLAKLSVVTPATANPVPVAPRTERNVGIGAFIGIILGFILAIVFSLMDTRIRRESDVVDNLGIPVLASIPATLRDGSAISGLDYTPEGEAFRKLRTGLEFLSVDEHLRTVLVTSPHLGDGKTTVVVNLAVALAEVGRSVVAVDADLRRPSLASRFGGSTDIGLSDVLRGASDVVDVLQNSPVPGLSIMGSGGIPPNPAELLGSRRAKVVLEELAQRFDYVLVDAPPVLPVTDPVVLSHEVDVVVAVVRSGQTSLRDLDRLVAEMKKASARVEGVVINGSDRSEGGYYGESYTYLPGSDKGDSLSPGRATEVGVDASTGKLKA